MSLLLWTRCSHRGKRYNTLCERTGCNKGAGCTYSHHPSLLWKDVLTNTHVVVIYPKRVVMQDWTVCDIPPFYFGLVFSVSRTLEREFKIIIKVPRREQVEDTNGTSTPQVRMYGSIDNVKACMERLSSILPVRVSAIGDKTDNDASTDPDEPIPILWDSIGSSSSDPLRKLCDELGIHERETTEADRYRTQSFATHCNDAMCVNNPLCTHFRQAVCERRICFHTNRRRVQEWQGLHILSCGRKCIPGACHSEFIIPVCYGNMHQFSHGV